MYRSLLLFCTDPDIPVVNAIKYTNCIKMIQTHQFGAKELSFPTVTLEVTDSLQVAQIFFFKHL